MQTSFNGYTDKEVLADALTMQKNVTGILNGFSNECKNPAVRKIMLDILDDEHSIQFDVFNDMHERGFYKTTLAPQDKVSTMKSTYANSANKPISTGAWHTRME